MHLKLQLGNLTIDVVRKDIKNIHLSVIPPDGSIKVSAPNHIQLSSIRAFLLTKLVWIKQQRQKIKTQARETPREFLERESHYLWGERLLLKLKYAEGKPSFEKKQKTLWLYSNGSLTIEQKKKLLDKWYRSQLYPELLRMAIHWENILGVELNQIYLQRMKTRWGSSNPIGKNIRINLELAKKPRECLEYIVVHELMHFKIPSHNDEYKLLMNQYFANWQQIRAKLSELPVGYAEWESNKNVSN